MIKNDKNNNTNVFQSLMFIFSFIKKYWVGLIFVIGLVIGSTYLQVITPKITGESIDKMIFYVQESKIEEIIQNIEDGEGLTSTEKQQLINNMGLTEQEAQDLEESNNEDLKNMYQLNVFFNELYAKNNTTILKGKGFSEVQKEFIQKADIDQKIKMGLLYADSQTITKMYLSNQEGMTNKDKENIANLNQDELVSYYQYNQVKTEAINLNIDGIKSLEGFDQNQIDYINNSELTSTQKSELLSLSSEELKDSAQVRKIKTNPEKSYQNFIVILIKLIMLYLLLAFVTYLYNILMAVLAGKSTRDMRKGLFTKLENLSIRFFDTSNAGDVLSRFTNDIDNISTAMNQSLVQVVSQVAMLIGIMIMMITEDNSVINFTINGTEYQLTHLIVWIMLTFALVSVIIAMFIIKKARKHVSQQQKKLGNLNGYIDERISGQKVIISYGLEDQTIEGFEKYNEDLKTTTIKGQIYSGILMPFMQGMGLINLAMIVFLGSSYVAQGIMTIGLLTSFIQYSQRFFGPLAQIVSQYNLLELGVTGGSRVKEIYEEKVEIIDINDSKEFEPIENNVNLKNINFSYNPGTPILKDINIEVKKGQMIALVGPTGSGKTTVMNLMNRFYDIDSGEISFDGVDIKDIKIDSLRKNVGIVLQESTLFSGTIYENISYGKDDSTKEEVIKAAKAANIHDFIMTLENGYETEVNNNSSMFSTGQKQLISIARTILTEPELLILDEATSNVDTVTEARIQKAMENILGGRTSFVIAHRLKTILNADKIIVLKDGEIIEEGNHQELIQQNGFYAELYYNQFVVEK